MTEGNAVLTSPTLLRDLEAPAHREAAWRTFLQRYQPLIYRWSCRTGLSHDDAEEVSAAVLCKLVTALRDFVYNPAHRFRGWLKTLVENEVREALPAAGAEAGRSGERPPHRPTAAGRNPDTRSHRRASGAAGRHAAPDLRNAEEITRRVQERVEPHTWQAFWLTAIGKESGRDVADRLGLKVAAVYMAKRRVGQMLRAEAESLQAVQREGASDDSLS